MSPHPKWMSFLLGVVGIGVLVVLTYVITVRLANPWLSAQADRRIAEWQRLRDEGVRLLKADKYAEAEPKFKAALSYAENKLLAQRYRVGACALLLAEVYMGLERFDEARAFAERDLRISEELDGESSPRLVPSLDRAGEACRNMGDLDAALAYAQRAVSIMEREDRPSKLASALNDLATVYELQKDYEAALPVRERILEIKKAQLERLVHEVGVAQYQLGLTHNVLGNYGEAEELYGRCWSVWKETDPPALKWKSRLVREYSRLLETTGRPDEAARLRATVDEPSEGEQQRPQTP